MFSFSLFFKKCLCVPENKNPEVEKTDSNAECQRQPGDDLNSLYMISREEPSSHQMLKKDK